MGFEEQQTPYISASQNARVLTERWVDDWIYCPNCGRKALKKYKNNKPVADFLCENCGEDYELKSQKNAFGMRIVDGAYRTMCERLTGSSNPNLFLLSYDFSKLEVMNFFVVPKQFFVPEIIEERKPLAATARRHGWIGCNILLNLIPKSGKIFLVHDSEPQPKETVLSEWKKTLFLRNEALDARGWLVDVMRCVDKLGRRDFQLSEVYAFEEELSQLYPNNRHVRQKIRQQLQVLRDSGYLKFVSRGCYRLT